MDMKRVPVEDVKSVVAGLSELNFDMQAELNFNSWA
jgi:hypothetical protein